MNIKLMKKTYLALAVSLTVIAGAVSAEGNLSQEEVVSHVPDNENVEKELSTFEEFLIVLGLKEKEEGDNTLRRGIGDCKVTNCKRGKVKH